MSLLDGSVGKLCRLRFSPVGQLVSVVITVDVYRFLTHQVTFPPSLGGLFEFIFYDGNRLFDLLLLECQRAPILRKLLEDYS